MFEQALRRAGIPVERRHHATSTHEFFGMSAVSEVPPLVAFATGRCWLLLCLAAIAGGCARGAREPSAELAGVEWRLAEIDGTAARGGGGGGREPPLRFDADSARVTGFTTCNSMFGRYEAPGSGRLRFAQLGSTKMACV